MVSRPGQRPGSPLAGTAGLRVPGPGDVRHACPMDTGRAATIERDGDTVAEVSKRWFRVRDTYGVEVAPGENDVLILATTAVIDTMAHPAR